MRLQHTYTVWPAGSESRHTHTHNRATTARPRLKCAAARLLINGKHLYLCHTAHKNFNGLAVMAARHLCMHRTKPHEQHQRSLRLHQFANGSLPISHGAHKCAAIFMVMPDLLFMNKFMLRLSKTRAPALRVCVCVCVAAICPFSVFCRMHEPQWMQRARVALFVSRPPFVALRH